MGAAITTLRRLLQLYPKHPRALFALGQMHAVLRDWRASEMHYQESAVNETVRCAVLWLVLDFAMFSWPCICFSCWPFHVGLQYCCSAWGALFCMG